LKILTGNGEGMAIRLFICPRADQMRRPGGKNVRAFSFWRKIMNAEDALEQILRTRMCYSDAASLVKSVPGIYVFHASAAIWSELGLQSPSDSRPLYVGKSESSLKRRPIADHFGERSSTRRTSPTGSSSPRRSLAALLSSSLSLKACPRNPDSPGYYDRYGLEYDCDCRLTDWMRRNLQISLCPISDPCDLEELEASVAGVVQPPLYLDTVFSQQHRQWVEFVLAARRRMAQEAKAWCAAPMIRA
jgi:hypothetical protein